MLIKILNNKYIDFKMSSSDSTRTQVRSQVSRMDGAAGTHCDGSVAEDQAFTAQSPAFTRLSRRKCGSASDTHCVSQRDFQGETPRDGKGREN